MKTKSYTKYLGILLVIVSVFTLFFNWISAARYIKNLQKAASDSLGFFSDYSYTDALIEDAIDSLDDTLDDLRDSAEDLEYYSMTFLAANKARSVAKKATRILKTIKDFALSPGDAALICADASSILRTAVKYEMISESTTDSDEYKRGKTIMFVISLMFWAALLLGIAALAMRVLGRSSESGHRVFRCDDPAGSCGDHRHDLGKRQVGRQRAPPDAVAVPRCAVRGPHEAPAEYQGFRIHSRACEYACLCASFRTGSDLRILRQQTGSVRALLLPLRRTRCTGKTGCLPPRSARPAARPLTTDINASCPNCGSPVTRYAPTSWVCPTCGATLDANTRFCPTCGHPKI